ncbi:hypothetical protein CCR75_007503 [Bremia lactucae]|uniref:Uncharacterized protein n=1 Tax=Bremia lactucae TaxID=4779 RepID=A0A976FRK3_BRELC|nr:hypothetical protein CCR75_007503 [Bremia lactucae]
MATTVHIDTPRRMKRDLARALLDPQSQGVAAYVQECVHSTSIGVDATFVFLLKVIEELDDAIEEFLPIPPNKELLPHENEVELGTLLSAASLTIRYVTEKQAMALLLQRYCDAFRKVLEYREWSHKCFYGLKAVALMGSTRVLESFGTQVVAGDVIKLLRFLFTLFKNENIGNNDQRLLRLNVLLRPSCEFVTVALQTHVVARKIIFFEVLPQMLQLLTRIDADQQNVVVTEEVQVDLAATVAVLLDAAFPCPLPNPFALLSLPAFVEEMEADETKLIDDNAVFSSTTQVISKVADGEEDQDSVNVIVEELEKNCCKALYSWLKMRSRRMVAAPTLAIAYRVVASVSDKTFSATSLTAPLFEISNALKNVKLTAREDFDYMNAILESIRDIYLYQHTLVASTIECAFEVMSTVMSRLETALAAFPVKHSTERRSAKAACSTIRHTLVEAFLAWLHHPNAANLLLSQIDFLHNVAGTLADPRVYGDVLATLRTSNVPEARVEYATGRQLTVVTLSEAINQLDRYSKSTVNRIVSGLTRFAAACCEDMYPLANELVLPLLPAMLDGSQWGKFLRLRTEAIATILIGCAQSDDFRVENHPWIGDFISFLLDPVVSSENVHSFIVLNGLIRTNSKLLEHVASFCVANPRTVSQTLHEPIARWPLYEEDIDLVVISLELIDALLCVNSLRESVDVDIFYATLLQLSDNAASEKLDVISIACKQVVATLGSKK